MKKFYCIFLIGFILTSANLFAVPAYPLPIDVKQPDGITLNITLKGDEYVSWAESSDGYTLLRNSNNFWEYAQRNAQGDLALSGRIAKNIQQRDAADNAFLSQIQKKMGYSSSQVTAFHQIKQARQQAMDKEMQRATSQSGTPQRISHISGVVRAPLILVDFPGKPFTRTAAEFELLCNQANYTATADGAITGSVNDYFKTSSYNQLDFQVDVWGPFTMDYSIAHYDDEVGGNPRLMAQEAVIAAHNAGCNFADYDVDNDDYVDGVHIIYAGYDQSAGEPAGQGIWAHAWNIPSLYLDGKRVYRYSCSSELRNTSSSAPGALGKITYIGVICHELSHVFGLPDLYDTDYGGSGGQSVHVDQWCLMASGSWNNDGMTPALHSAWCRNELGWATIITLEDPADITIPNPATQCDIYKITTTTPNEYFLLENRQKQGWDEYIPASGLLIYHVDENNGLSNKNPAHRGLYVKQAGGNATSTSKNRATDPYPQSANDSFTDNSIPNSKSWAGTDTDKPVTDIIHDIVNKTITFQFIGGATTCLRPTKVYVDNITTYSADIYWIPFGIETSWKLSYKKQSESTFTETIVTNSPYHLSGLDVGTDYDIQIRAICSDAESYARPSTFKTLRCNDMVNYTVISHDYYGDSWEGNQLLIKQNGVVIATIETPHGVKDATHTVPFCHCEAFEAVWVRGYLSEECSFEIKDNNNVQIFASGRTDCANYSNDQVVYSGVAACSIIPPTVVTNSATEIKLTTATLHKTITAGEEPITEQGFKYKKISESTWQTSTTGILTDLTPRTQYHFYAYATTATYLNEIKGETLTFTTFNCDSAFNYTIISHDLFGDSWNGNQLLIKQDDVVIATIEPPYGVTTATYTVPFCPCEIFEAVWVSGNYPDECSFEIKDNNNVQIFASGTNCANYSNNQVVYSTTTTCSIIPPTVVTNVATEVTLTTATLNKTVTAGEEPVIEQGFKYKKISESTWQTSTTGILTDLTPHTQYQFYAYATTITYKNINGATLTFATLDCDDVLNYTVVSHSAYGYGWNNNQLHIKQNGIVVATIEPTGFGNNHVVPFCPCETFEVVWVRGSYPEECSFEIKDNNNVEIFASGTNCANYSNNQVVYSTTTTCSIIPPMVVTNAATGITQTTAMLNKTVTAGEEPITAQGFKYKKISETTWQTNETGILTDLTPYTQYQFYAYATTETYPINGVTLTFTTLDCDDVLNYTVISHTISGYGWMGSQLLIKQNGGVVAIIEPYGYGDTHTVQLCPCEIFEAVWVHGSYPGECSFEIKDNNNVEIFVSGTDCINYSNNQVVYSAMTTCSIIPPTVITNTATEVAQTSATLHKTVTTGEEPITAQGFKYKKTSETTWQTSETGILTDLTPNTQYEFYAYATTAIYISTNGETLTFSTLPHVAPTVITDAATEVTQTTTTLNKTITVGTETITAQGFKYKKTSESTWQTSETGILTNLTPNTQYEFYAYATTETYPNTNGETLTFSTLPHVAPTVITDAATEVTQTTTTLNKTITVGTEPITAQGFKYKKISETTWQTSDTGILTDLTPNTQYEFYAYATTETYPSINGETLTFATINTSIDEYFVQKLQIFPNPVKDEIFIKSDSPIEKVELYSLAGNLLLLESNFSEKISVAALSSGIYMIKIYTDKGLVVSKIVKE